VKISVVDVFVIVLVGVSLFSFFTKYEPKYTYEFSGSQIYRAVRECDELDSTGFLYTVYVKGYWNMDVGHFEEEGVVTGTGRGFIEMVLRDGRTVTVGGRMSYKEDIQAVDIEIRLASKSSVAYWLKPVRGSKDDIKKYVEDSSRFINYEKQDIAVTAVLVIDTDTEQSLELESEIEDVLRTEIFFMKKGDIEIYDDGITVFLERVSLEEFDDVIVILETYFEVGEIYARDVKVVYQTAEEIDVEDVVVVEAYTSDVIYPGSIHVRV
jgi:hypothetical protein